MILPPFDIKSLEENIELPNYDRKWDQQQFFILKAILSHLNAFSL